MLYAVAHLMDSRVRGFGYRASPQLVQLMPREGLGESEMSELLTLLT